MDKKDGEEQTLGAQLHALSKAKSWKLEIDKWIELVKPRLMFHASRGLDSMAFPPEDVPWDLARLHRRKRPDPQLDKAIVEHMVTYGLRIEPVYEHGCSLYDVQFTRSRRPCDAGTGCSVVHVCVIWKPL
jgi:hypothetical protein